MTHAQLQRMIKRRKGGKSWRALGSELGVAFQDLCKATKSADIPKAGVLRALKVKTVTETRYRMVK